MARDIHDFEQYPPDVPKDETDVNLRAYFVNMDDKKIAEYDSSWSDEKVVEWDGNFKNDDSLMLVCSERDVEIEEYREVIQQYIDFKKELEKELAG